MIAHTIQLDAGFGEAIESVTAALAAEGFGVITRIDMHKTFAEKLGVEFREFTSLGACNPQLAHKAVSERPEIGLLLPCNVTVEARDGGTLVRLPDARAMLSDAGGGDSAVLAELAADAGDRLDRVASNLSG